MFPLFHLQEAKDKHVFIGSQQLLSHDELTMHMQGRWSHGIWGGELRLERQKLGWGLLFLHSGDTGCQHTFFVTRKCKKQAWETGGQLSSPHSLSSCRTFVRNENWRPLSFTIPPTKPSSGLISSVLRILPHKWIYLLNRNSENDFSLWNILRSPMSVYENGGFVFLRSLHFLKITGNYFLKEIHNSLGDIFALTISSSLWRSLLQISLWDIQCVHSFSDLNKKKRPKPIDVNRN